MPNPFVVNFWVVIGFGFTISLGNYLDRLFVDNSANDNRLVFTTGHQMKIVDIDHPPGFNVMLTYFWLPVPDNYLRECDIPKLVELMVQLNDVAVAARLAASNISKQNG